MNPARLDFHVNSFHFSHYVASLARPQLAKQMCIAADMERVFEIGPGEYFVFDKGRRCGTEE